MCRGNRKRDVTTMVTYSHATTPLGQSERAYYVSYFIIKNSITLYYTVDKIIASLWDVSLQLPSWILVG